MLNNLRSFVARFTPQMPILRFPTADSPMPAFFFLESPGSSQSTLPAPESPRQRTQWQPISQPPLPTLGPLVRPDTQGIFSRNTDFEQDYSFGHFSPGSPESLESTESAPETPETRRFRPPLLSPPAHLPTFSLLERPENLGIFSRHPNFEHEYPFGLDQLAQFEDYASLAFDHPPSQRFHAHSFMEYPSVSIMQDATASQAEGSSSVIDNSWPSNQSLVDDLESAPWPSHSSGATNDELSPLPLPLPGPTSSDDGHLKVNFGGDLKHLQVGWNTLSVPVEKLLKRPHESLTVTWFPSSPEDDPRGWRGNRTFTSLFNRLTRQSGSGQAPLAAFKRITINVSERLEELDLLPITGLDRTVEEKIVINGDRVDLSSTLYLEEFRFQGSHLFLAEKLLNLPRFLTLLSITCSKISVNDTLFTLQACPYLTEATFATVCAEVDCELGNRFDLKLVGKLPSMLLKLTITTSVDVTPFMRSLDWKYVPIITINVLDDNVAEQNWGPCFACIPSSAQLKMNGNFSDRAMASIEGNNVVFGQ
ncbi:hypothetical protein M413DRAFT_29550 [Hebeloma cylindrosporum]|uniref:Uncharacterized protein n=1 Tax=Hebeloma cylindrosporum TaxID=76867 RepID=A0A0C2Y2E6_HEBCY|nr:hypothetical protein M413DRAFT_32616 [Hebeloma cylindrosporum h7]KIM39401.1 hypothetical protein M413DRAFT_29550 [Hebeloma cylindrosporum h7]